MLRAGRGRGLSPPTTRSSLRLCLRLLSLAPSRFLLCHRAVSAGRSGWWASSRSASCATPQGPAGSESGIPVVPLEIPIVRNLSVCNLSGDDSGVCSWSLQAQPVSLCHQLCFGSSPSSFLPQSAAANHEGHARSFLYTYTELSAAWIDFQAKQAC